jgi:O-antigen/teichoic acid export membrane protein
VSAAARTTRTLGLGSAANGLLAYLVFVLTTRSLGPDAASPVSVLWSYWAFAGAAFTFPLQHWIARTVAAHGDGAVREAVPRIGALVLAVSLVLGGAAWVAREPLFHRSDAWFPAMVAGVTLGSAVIGVLRGGLSARHRWVALAWSLASENAVRCVGVGILIVVGNKDVVAYGLCLVAGPAVAAVWPSAFRFRATTVTGRAPNPLAFLAGASLAQLIGQVVLTGGPVVLALAGGSPREVTTLFAALALFRAPYMLALGMVAQLTTRVANLVIRGELEAMRRMRRGLRLGTAGLVVLAGLGAALLGPFLLRLIFGDEVVLSRALTALVAVGCTVAVANLVLMVSALAQGRSAAVARGWLVGIAASVVGFFALTALGVEEEAVVVWCFVIAETVAYGALSVVEQAERPRSR